MQERTFRLWDSETPNMIEAEAKKVGKEWMALCPKYQDNNASLCLREAKKVYYCQGCGWKGKLYDLGHNSGRKIIKTCDYRDEQGNLLFQAVRFDPKGFAQRRSNGKGGWVWNLKGVRRVLYRLPELLNAPNPVFIVEGEKDTDNLWKWGLTATTSPMGAKKWEPEYDKYLTNRGIILLPDNDTEDFQHMGQVGKNLSGRAKQIKWLELLGLEELEEKEDVRILERKTLSWEEYGEFVRKLTIKLAKEKHRMIEKHDIILAILS